MGDPKRVHKHYVTPPHLWQGTRIEDENKLKAEYGLKNNTEIWHMEGQLRSVRRQAKKLIGTSDEKADQLQKELISRLTRIGVLNEGATMDDVLAMNTRSLLDRRIQTIVFRKGIARTAKEARQMITHGQITLRGDKHTAPGTIVTSEEEKEIAYIGPVRELKAGKPMPAVKESEEEEETEKPKEEKVKEVKEESKEKKEKPAKEEVK